MKKGTIKLPSQKEIARLVADLKKSGVNVTTGDKMREIRKCS